jgi:hypothetical protein
LPWSLEEREEWEAALKEEHRSIERAKTYELVDRPKDRRSLGVSMF